MDKYNYPYSPSFPPSHGDGDYPDHGDGFGQYYGTCSTKHDDTRRSTQRKTKQSEDDSRSRSLSRSRSRSQSDTRSRSASRSRSSRSHSSERRCDVKKLNWREPKFVDAFRVLYLTPSKQKQNAAKYLATKKKQDSIQKLLKRDGLGSKHWFFYPRPKKDVKVPLDNVPEPQESCDKRIKVDADFFRKYKKSKNLDTSAPIAKLKTWELILYKKLGFIQAV